MTALIGYQLATLARSQRWVGPLITYLAVLGFVYESDAGPAVIAFGVTGYALFVVCAWLTAATLSAENEIAREVTAATTGSQVRVQVATLSAAIAGGLVLAAIAVGWALVANPAHTSGVKAVAGGFALHAVFALLGIAVGAVFGRPLVNAPGQAALGIIAVAMLALVVPHSPVLACLRVLENNPAREFSRQLAPTLAVLLAVSAGGLACSLVRTRGRS